MSDQTNNYHDTQQITCNGYPSVAWQQQMGTAKTNPHNRMQTKHKPVPQNQTEHTQDLDSTFTLLPQIAHRSIKFEDDQYKFDPSWEDNIYHQGKLEYQYIYNDPIEQNEGENIIADSHLLDKTRYALTDLWTVEAQLPSTSPLTHFASYFHTNKLKQQPVFDNEIALQPKTTPVGREF